MSFPAFAADKVIPISNETYSSYVRAKVRVAARRIWAGIFIIDPRPETDVNGSVRDFIEDLEQAAWRRIDVRILIGVSNTLDIQMANAVAYEIMLSRGIPVRYFKPTKRKATMHSKYVVFDNDLIVLGGHNWSPGSFERYVQDSVGIFSRELNRMLGAEFAANWNAAQDGM